MSILVLFTLIAAVAAFAALRAGENLRFETSTDPHRIVMAAVGIVGAKRRWEIVSQSDHGANFRYHKQPSTAIAVVLVACFVIPGIVYILLAGKRESLVLSIDPATTGMVVVQATSNGFRGRAAARELQRQVALPAGSLGTHPQVVYRGR